MSNDNNSEDAQKRKEKLQALRTKREVQQTSSNTGGQSSDNPGFKNRLIKALTNRRQNEAEAGSGRLPRNNETRGVLEMNEGSGDAMPRKKFAMKKMAMKKMAMKKRAMMAKKKRAKGQGDEAASVDASSTLKEISQHRGKLENRINKLKEALADRTAELKEVMELEAAKMKENKT